MEWIKIKNASLHNLKHVNVEIPKNRLTVVTGVSGSGKTTLISDILDEAGCCEYLECLGLPQETSVYDFYESITGLNPTVSVKSSNESRWNPRSTVGTKTGILNYLRLLYLTEGKTEGILPVESRQLSFNSSAGKCKTCNGTGSVVDVDFGLFRKNSHMTLPELCTLIPECKPLKNQLSFLAEALDADLSLPLREQPAVAAEAFLHGLQSQKSHFRGIGPHLVRLYGEDRYIGTLLRRRTCPECRGDRLNKAGRSIKIEAVSLPEASQYSVNCLQDFIGKLTERATTTELGKNIGKLLVERLDDLIRVGLGYLNLYRTIPSLSGGEYQRLKLAELLQSTMEDLVIIADEPLTGLHPTEKVQVLDQMRFLCDKGNTVIIIEHNVEAMKRADHIIDFGPFGGARGGTILYEGSFSGLLLCEKSITAQYIHKVSEISELPGLQEDSVNWLQIKNANANNLKNIEVSVPLHTLVGIAGVSGSGKSSLIAKTLVPLLKKHFSVCEKEEDAFFDGLAEDTCQGASLWGASHISGYVYVSQYPIGRNSRSTVATYTGLMKDVQAVFAKGRTAGKDLDEILGMSITEARAFFDSEKKIQSVLWELEALGLGYLTLGQPTPALSGGEAQRIKLFKSLLENKGNMLYLLDEPTIGLGLYDIYNLKSILRRLIDRGHSVVVIEHDAVVLSACQWIIEIGPGADSFGGEVIAQGTPYALTNNEKSGIGRYLNIK